MLASARKLASIGADFLICPDNTIHQAFAYVEPHSPVPWLHIADVVAAGGRRPWFQSAGAYRNAVARRERGLPGEARRPGTRLGASHTGRTYGDQPIIMDELIRGHFTGGSVAILPAGDRPDEGRGLRCGDPGMHRDPAHHQRRQLALPVLDSTRLLPGPRCGGRVRAAPTQA